MKTYLPIALMNGVVSLYNHQSYLSADDGVLKIVSGICAIVCLGVCIGFSAAAAFSKSK